MFEDLKEFAKENNVPIIKDEGLNVLLSVIESNSYKSVLEIGCAIGYSSIVMAKTYGVDITTIERNSEMYNLAISNISKYNLEDKIEVVFTDALEYTPKRMYDLIFIDAAKAQNIKLFERFEPYLNKGGAIVVDNLDFHGLTDEDPSKLSKNLRSLTRKIREFIDYLKNRNDYDTVFTHLGDGMSVSKRK